MTAGPVGSCLGLSERPVSMSGRDDSAVGKARRKERADRERRLEGLAVAVLTAIGERDSLVRDAERRAAQALPLMTDQVGLSIRDVVNGAEAQSHVGRRRACGNW
jgi:hypothetical protein